MTIGQAKFVFTLIVALAFATVGGLAYKYRGDAAVERGRRAVAEINLLAATKENTKLADQIVGMEEQARVNNEIVLDLANSVAALRAEQNEATRERGNLKSENSDVKAYLNTCVPEPLRRLLDKRIGNKDATTPGCPGPDPVEPAKGL
ncbi:hypothetical protein [Aminobacter phage Erebus]|nr:hypothetical protein [Aminobacter phage Erebus]